MIKEKCFSEDWLDAFKRQTAHKRIDKIILEKMIYALHLLEHLKMNGLDFVFKGGTSLILLLEKGNRFSIDIDIICNVDRETLETILNKVISTSRFSEYTLDEHRSYQPGVPKAHYGFAFDSATKTKYSGKILLDVLCEESIYPELTERPVQSKWIEVEKPALVTVPTIDAITGDKLTAFAPNTIGIPYFKGKIPFAMEICKQLFDLSQLFARIEDMEMVAASFRAFAQQEILYRDQGTGDHLTPDLVLKDTIDTCLLLARRGKGAAPDAKEKFLQLQNGIRAFGTGFLMVGNFRIDDAVVASARVAYLAAKILVGDLSPLVRYAGEEVKDLSIASPDWNFLNRLKRQPDKSSFYYWLHTVDLLTAA